MGVQRFVGSNNREAMGRVRAALGDDALILANRATDQGVEILALAEDDASGYSSSPEAPRVAPEPANRERPAERGLAEPDRTRPDPTERPDLTEQLLREVRDMREQLNRRAPVAGDDGPRPALRRRLLGAGFSALFSDPLLDGLPPELRSAEPAADWLQRQLQRRLSVAAPGDLEQPGVTALVGPTGVGKTTTAAKLAARLARRHGAERVALVSADSYRIGARDQLRIYADLLGVALYSLDEGEHLDRLAGQLADTPWVVVDTIGMSQRDARLGEQLRQLNGRLRVRPVLLLNAASQGETLEEVVTVYRGTARTAGLALDDAIISKQDEASRLGPVLDTALRYHLRLHFVCRGQRVPEDMVAADAAGLVDDALALTGDGGEDDQPGAAGWTRRVLAQGRALDAAVSLLRDGAPDFTAIEDQWHGRSPTGQSAAEQAPIRFWQGGARPAPALALDDHGLPIGVPAATLAGEPVAGAAQLLPAPPDAALWRALQESGQPWLAAARGNSRVWHRGRRLPLSECYPLAGPWDSLMVRHRGRAAQLRLRRLDLAASPARRGDGAPFTALLCAWFGEIRDLDSGRLLGRRYWQAPSGQSREQDSALLRHLLRCEEWPALRERAAGQIDAALEQGEGAAGLAGALAALAIRLDQDNSDWALDLRAQLLSLTGTRRRSAAALLKALVQLFRARRDLQRIGAAPGGTIDA